MVLSLILAESSIELVPKEILHHPSVVRLAEKKRKQPAELVLDQTYHHSAILKLPNHGTGRGRPDIAHLSLLLALGSPLNSLGQLRCYVHTRDDRIITVDPKTRLPRNTDRFTSLLEQLYQEGTIPPKGRPLLSIKRGTIRDLVNEKPHFTIALTTEAVPLSVEEVASKLAKDENPALIIGGFPTGHFSKQTLSSVDESYRVSEHSLEAWTVVARAVYAYERAMERKSVSSGN